MVEPRIRSSEAPSDLIWIEGEDAKSASNRRHSWYDSVRKTELSGNEWLSHFGGQPARATYHFEVPDDGSYNFWIRANPQGKPVLKYKLDDGEFEQVDFSNATQRLNIAADGQPDLRYVAWIDVGKVELSAGRHSLSLEMASKNKNHGGVDVIVFSKEAFTPNHALKPGEKSGKADAGKWAFEPSKDPLEEGALLDLSYLNPIPAGKNGFIQLSGDGESFVDGQGRPVRFWSGTSYIYRDGATVEEIAEVGRFYAKRGINLVRYHGNLSPKKSNDFSQPDLRAIDDIQRYVAGMKQAGVYVAVSPYWGSHTDHNKAWDVADPGHKRMSGLLFFDPKTQEAYLNWLKVLFTRDNPHTGIPLKDEPAMAVFQIQNEDSLLFWTAQNIQGEARAILRKQYAVWLTDKYGSLDNAFAAWGGDRMDTDDVANGEVGIYTVWHLTQDTSNPGKAARLTDQLEFLNRTMRNWNERVETFLREEIGAPHLINAGNWRTADNVKLMDAERWSYTANEVLGINKYYGVVHTGPKSGYAILKGDKYVPKSALRNPRAMPTNIKQAVGHPMIIPESQWVPPNPYQSEGPLAIAAYQSLTGVDSFFWFTIGDGFGTPFGKWQTSTPVQMGMFPAAALMFRNHYLEEGEPVVVEERSLENIFSRSSTIIAADAGFDPLRDTGNLPQQSNVKDGVHPLAFLAGPVKVKYDGDAANSTVSDQLEGLIDEENGLVTGITNQVRLDHKQGVLLVNSPKAQAAAGFLSKVSPITLSDVRIATRNEYTSVYVVSLDGEDLAESGNILVQAATTARPYGYQEKPVRWSKDKDRFEGFEITNLGSNPWNLEKNSLDILIRNKTVSKAYVLDANGYAIAELDLAEAQGGKQFSFPENALYVILR